MMFAERVRRALVDHRFVKALALVAFASHATSLGAGYLVDDHTHRYFARGETIPGGPRGLWDMYRFADGGVGVRQAIDEGFHPWWTSSSLKLAFFRPVASLLRFVEEKAFGDHAVFAHLVSCALFVATVVALHAAYRRWIGGAAAGLAALLFALDDAHATTVTWIAARHSLLAMLGVASSLLLFLRARDAGKVSYAAGACFFLGLLSSEAALSAVPFFVVLVAVSDPRPPGARVKAITPLLGALVLWGALYAALGCGASSSSYYIDPVHDPVRFAEVTALRLPALGAAQLFFPPSELGSMQRVLAPKIAVFGALVLAGGAILAWRSTERRRTLALYAAFVASLVPACGTNADDRLLMIPGVAGMAFLAVVCRDVYRARRGSTTLPLRSRALLVTVGVVHVGFALLLGPLRSIFFATSMGGFVGRGAAALYAFEHPESKDMVLVTSPDGLLPTSMYLSRWLEGLPVPRSSQILVTAPAGAVTLTRDDAASFSITATGGTMRDPFVGAVRDRPFCEGETVSTPKLDVTVGKVTPEGSPITLVFRFRATLDRPDVTFVRWTSNGPAGKPGYAPFVLPRPGETMALEPVDFAEALAGR